jgi:hypothetical protein
VSRDPDPLFDEWVNRARDASGEEMLAHAQRLGAQLKKAGGGEWVGPCPQCGGTDRFSINPKKRAWNCRGAQGGKDAIGLVMHTTGCDFIAAVAEVTGEPPPRGDGKRIEPEVAKERRKERQDDQMVREQKAAQEVEVSKMRARDLWDYGRAAAGTLAEAELRNRGCSPTEEHIASMRFIPALEYRGFPDEDAKEEVPLGSFPCRTLPMYAANGEIAGVHRTYIDPKTGRKLKPPGDWKRNLAKKAMGRAGATIIRIGFLSRCIAIAEGVETAISWFNLGVGPEDVSIAAAYSMGNLSGRSTDTIPHPTKPKASIQNGEPDPKEPGAPLPSICEEVILLGDGDSDEATTKAHILTAGRRYRAQGIKVFVHMAPPGMDWDDFRVKYEAGDVDTIPPIQTFEEFEAEVKALIRPAFKSNFGGVRWQDLGKTKPKYEWLVKGLIARREVSFLAGPSQSGKSFLVTDLSLAVARGVPWFNRVVRPGAVVYIAAESYQGVTNLRLPAYAQHHGIGFDAELPFLVLTKSPNFYRDEEQVLKLITEVLAFEEACGVKVELVVLDTFSAATRGADEIKGVDMSKVHDRIKLIVEKAHTAVLVVHHMNKAGESLRGHSSLFGDVDSVITCQIDENKRDADGRPIRIARADKVKEGANRHKIEFVLRQVEIGTDEDGDRITSCVIAGPAKVVDDEAGEPGDYEFKSDNSRLLFSCLHETLKRRGRAPDAGTPSPPGQRVATVAQWRELYGRRAPQDDTMTVAEREKKVQRAVATAITRFQQLNLIGHDNGFVWFTGRAVRGFDTAAIRKIAAEPEADAGAEAPSMAAAEDDMEIPL